MMAMHNTRKLTLAEDKYSRQLHYVNDNGANYCYCKWWQVTTAVPPTINYVAEDTDEGRTVRTP